MTTFKTTMSWILAVLLAVFYLAAAAGKLTGQAVPMFEAWGYAAWFATLIGVAELVGAIGLLIPKTTKLAVGGLTLIMFGAVYTHVAAGEPAQVLRPGIFLVLLWTLCWLRSGAASASPARSSAP